MMSDAFTKKRTQIALAVVFLLAVGLGLWWWNRPKPAPPGPKLNIVKTVEKKERAVAHLELGEYAKAEELLLELADELPDEILPTRNLVIARLLMVNPKHRSEKPEEWDRSIEKLNEALELMKEREGDSALVYYFAGKYYQLLSQLTDASEFYEKAAELEPKNVAFHYARYLVSSASRKKDIKAKAEEALETSFQLQPENLILFQERIVTLAQKRAPRLQKILEERGDLLLPLIDELTRFGNDSDSSLTEELPAALMAVKEGKWEFTVTRNGREVTSTVSSTLTRFRNLTTKLQLMINDRPRVDWHPLEFVLHDFSDEFYKQHQLPESETEDAIKVELAVRPFSVTNAETIRSFQLADLTVDREPELVLLHNDRLEVLTRRDQKWSPLVEWKTEGDYQHIQAGEFDHDLMEQLPEDTVLTRSQIGDLKVTADLDLLVYGVDGIVTLRNRFEKKTQTHRLEPVEQDDRFQALREVATVAILDVDHDKDLDLVIAAKSGLSIWSNRGDFTFYEITNRSQLPPVELQPQGLAPVDWNRDQFTDVVLTNTDTGQVGLLENIAHGRFRWMAWEDDWQPAGSAVSVSVLESDSNFSWDLVTAREDGVSLIQSEMKSPRLVSFLKKTLLTKDAMQGLRLFDYDNDGVQDLLVWNTTQVRTFRGLPGGTFSETELLSGSIEKIKQCEITDLDRDGDQDVIVLADGKFHWLENQGGNENHWLKITLVADPDPQYQTERNNSYGVGALLEIKAGDRYQVQIVSENTTHLGLGKREQADVVRVIWPNGIPQPIISVQGDQEITEVQMPKGSCPFLYLWNGERYEFYTDLLWAAPLGLQFAEGVVAPAREWEYLHIPGERLKPIDDEYRLQITEELWEAGYFDRVKLIAIDHPANVEIFSNEKVGPAEIAGYKVHTVKERRLPKAVTDQNGNDLLPKLRAADGEYVAAFESRITQGYVPEHALEIDLGDLKDPQQVTLFLRGWLQPSDTSLNVGISQQPKLSGPRPPSLSVLDADGEWKEVMPFMGFPGGKTKTIAVDLSDVFLTDDYRLKISTSMEFYWDAMFFTVDETPAEFTTTELKLQSAHLHYRGFSQYTKGQNRQPDHYAYTKVTTDAAWPAMQGRFTRYGDVTRLLNAEDDQLVVMGAGDEMTLRFAAPQPPKPGWKRDFFIYNVGWDKDADLNTVTGQTVEPLPFRGMQQYPFNLGEPPDSDEYHQYLQRYQTREQNHFRFQKVLHKYYTSP